MSFKLFFRYKSELIFLSSGFITPFVGFVVGLINAKYIPPYEMGVINSVLLIVNYLSFIQLGVFNGLNRNISFYKSKGKNYKVQSMVDTSFITSKVVSIISVSIICVVLGWNMWDGLSSSSNVIYGSYFLLLVIMIFLPRNSHYDVTFKSSQEFSTLGKIVLGENISYLLFSLSTVFWGIWGKLFADANKYVIGFFLRRRYSPFFFKREQSKEAYIELVQTGFPLLLGGYIWSLFTIADQTYIAAYLGKQNMGEYTLSRLLISALTVIPTLLNTLLYPKAASVFGQKEVANSLRPFWVKSVLLFTAIIIPISIIAYICLPPLVHTFLPLYSDGISSAKINILTGITFISMGPSVIFGTLRKNILYLIFVFISLLLFWGVLFLFRDKFLTLESVAWLRFAVSLFLSVFVMVYTFILTK